MIEMTEQILKISTGFIKGLKKTTVLSNKKYYSFQGVPYGEPPTGQNRFKDPLPCKPWEGVRDATKPGNICPQFHEFMKEIVGNEDCLFVNIYTPQIPKETYVAQMLLPVMVYIHGGGFTFGSGNDDIYGPDYIIEHDVVLVTLNYRVGVFGFLSLGNSDVPGNAGLKDQTLALKWVRDNIKYFSGDCNNVTLFGESAGSASVQYHTLSPLSSGLFHRAILQSGTALSPWAFVENAVPRAFILGELVGCKTDDVNQIATVLRQQSPETLVTHQGKVLNLEEKRKLTFPFVPCKEVIGTGSNFMTECPETMLKSGKFAEVSYVIGMNDKEGIIMLKENANLFSKLEKINNDPRAFVPHDLCSESDHFYNIVKNVKKFYFNDLPLTADKISDYIDLSTDLEFTIGIHKTLKYLSVKSNIPVYVYLFSFEGELGFLKSFIRMTISGLPKGVCHADDIGYLFHNSLISKELSVAITSPEIKVVDNFCTFWTNFAKYGDPNDKKFEVQWKPSNIQSPHYLDIGETLKLVSTTLMPNRTKFWENIYASVNLTNKL
ncbi:esterase FE4-like [Lycorma delicatula]|uniref:esterase FE4-like n=1 Tax=Lycorma delicatula TaxID=130591 RepID=UPI003F518580